MLHLWTFGLLFFHAHVFEPIHADFGAGTSLARGPHALMSQHHLNLRNFPASVEKSSTLPLLQELNETQLAGESKQIQAKSIEGT
jgi:hypothetical protein